MVEGFHGASFFATEPQSYGLKFRGSVFGVQGGELDRQIKRKTDTEMDE